MPSKRGCDLLGVKRLTKTFFEGVFMIHSRRDFLRSAGAASVGGILASLSLAGCNDDCGCESANDAPVAPTLPAMTEKEILDGIDARVAAYRTAEARLQFVDGRGKPVR